MPLEDKPLEESVYDSPPTGSMKPYDPTAFQSTSQGPAPSSTAPGIGDTPEEEGAQGGKPEAEEQDPLPEFDPRYRDELTGLIFLGALTDEFSWLGHDFKIRTLTTGELAEVALIAKPYAGSEAALKAWQAAIVAACMISVDGKAITVPLTNEVDDTMVRAKFRYVMDKWFPPVLDVVYQRYVALEYTVRDVLEAMGKASG